MFSSMPPYMVIVLYGWMNTMVDNTISYFPSQTNPLIPDYTYTSDTLPVTKLDLQCKFFDGNLKQFNHVLPVFLCFPQKSREITLRLAGQWFCPKVMIKASE